MLLPGCRDSEEPTGEATAVPAMTGNDRRAERASNDEPDGTAQATTELAMFSLAHLQAALTRKRMEPAGSGATWTGSPKGVFKGRKHHKPRQGSVTITLRVFLPGVVGFIDLLDPSSTMDIDIIGITLSHCQQVAEENHRNCDIDERVMPSKKVINWVNHVERECHMPGKMRSAKVEHKKSDLSGKIPMATMASLFVRGISQNGKVIIMAQKTKASGFRFLGSSCIKT
jgi:hypothetical protein